MANALSAVRDRIYAIRDTALPAIAKVFDVSAAKRRDWEKELGGATLAVPFGVFVWGTARQGTLSPTCRDYEIEFEFWYVTGYRGTGTATKSDRTILTEIEDALETFVIAIRAETGATAKFACIDHTIDVSDANEANAVLLRDNKAYYAGKATFTLIFGDAP